MSAGGRVCTYLVLAACLLTGCNRARIESPPSVVATGQAVDLRAPAAPGTRHTLAHGANGCVVHELSRRSLRLHGDPVYVNAMALAVSDGAAFIAGFPNYVWTSNGKGHKRDAVPESILGVVVDEEGRVIAVPNPVPGHLDYPYAVARPAGGWRIVFMELAQSRREEPWPKVLGIWSGVFNGGKWSDVERLPAPVGYEIDHHERASLLRVGDTVAFAVRVDPFDQVVLFQHVGGRWSWERVLVPSEKPHPEPVVVEHLALIPWEPGGLALLVNKEYPTIEAVHRSLFLYTREPGWREHLVVRDIERFVTAQFAVSTSPTADAVSWRAGPVIWAFMGRFATGRLHSLVVDSIEPRGPRAFNRIRYSTVTELADGGPLWITEPLAADDATEIQLFAASADSAVRAGTIALPYQFARLQAVAALAPGELLLAGGHTLSERSDSSFASIVMRERVHCSSP